MLRHSNDSILMSNLVDVLVAMRPCIRSFISMA